MNLFVVTSLYHFVTNIKTICGTHFRFIIDQRVKICNSTGGGSKLFIQSIVTNEIQNESAYLHGLELHVREFIRVGGTGGILLFIRR